MDSKFEDELLADSGDDDSQSPQVVLASSSSEVNKSPRPKPKEVEELKTSSSDDSDSSGGEGDEVDARIVRQAQVKASDSDSDLDSGEDEDEGMEVDEDALQAELDVVKDKLAADPWGYNLHVEKIRIVQAMGDLEEARRAREKMNEEYPLTPTMWVEWIRDEQKVISNDSEREYVVELFERAVEEYTSVEVWLEYISFCLGNMDGEGGMEKCRDIFERALASCGLNVSMGSLIWDAYRDFEGALIGSQQTEELLKAQEQRYVSLCRRQLKVPLFDMEKTYATVEQKLGEINEATRSGYEIARKKLREIEEWEVKLIQDSDYAEKRRIYSEYIEAEKKKSAKVNPVRVQSLYERALVDMPLDYYFWNDYVDFLSSHLKNPQVVLKVAERATRNCGYSSVSVWTSLMKVVEVFYPQTLEEEDESKKSSVLLEKMLKVFEQACARIGMTIDGAGTLWLKYLEFLRRQVGNISPQDHKETIAEEANDTKKKMNVIVTLRKTFTLAENHLRTLFAEPNDFIGEIAMFKARFESQIEASVTDSVRELWKDLFRRGYSANFSFWNQWIGEEIKYKGLDSKQIRKELSKAMKFVRDYPQLIANLWLNFERDNGDINTLRIAESQITEALEKNSATAIAPVHSTSGDLEDESNFKRNSNNDYGKGKKRKWDEKEPNKLSPKKGKYKSEGDETDGKVNKDEGDFKKPAVPPPQGKRVKDIADTSGKDPKLSAVPPTPVKHDSTKDSRTVFLSNLDFSVDEIAINDFFATTGELEEIRIVKDFKGRSKGFAYVVFKKESCAKAALALDRKPLGKRPAYVSKCDPDKSTRQPQFKYARSLERNKLFVKGLPFEMNETELRCMFEAFGPVKDCRLVTYRNGHSKGLAYIEFEQEAHASAAILKTDGSIIKGKEISVAISNPPAKGQPQSMQFVSTRSEPNQRRDRNVFVPRIVQSVSLKKAVKTDVETEAPVTTSSGPKSNDDFRKMFLKS